MAHTPGPWGIVFHGDVERIRLNGSTVYQVSDVTDPDFPSAQPRYCLDDLRLMAAAPELLAALRLAMEWSEDDGYPDDHCMVGPCERAFRQAARAAIAKAEGRTDEE